MPVNRKRTTFGGGGFGGGGMSLGFPPFTRAIKWLVIINAAIYLLMLILRGVAPLAAFQIVQVFGLAPAQVIQHGWVWQLGTYLFLHSGLFHILFNMLTLWMFGAALESAWGHRQFLEFYFFCGIGAALITIAVGYAGLLEPFRFLSISPETLTIGASGAIYGVMVAFAVYYGNQEFMMFPLPFTIRAKYLVAILIFISLAEALGGSRGQTVAQFAHLGGALVGWLYVRFVPRRGLGLFFSERYYGTRNAYYKWKRRRAARKFEVYMRKQDRSQYFDEYGNYRGHEDDPKKGDGEHRGPWVN
jgi:membrane associated rhomboid family serine protease